MWSRKVAEVQTEHQNGEERWFNWLGMVVISETANLLGFSHKPSLAFTENGQKIYPASGRCVDENRLLMWDVRDEWAYWFMMRGSNSNNHSLQPSLNTQHVKMAYSSRRPHRVPILSPRAGKWDYIPKQCLCSVHSDGRVRICENNIKMGFIGLKWNVLWLIKHFNRFILISSKY